MSGFKRRLYTVSQKKETLYSCPYLCCVAFGLLGMAASVSYSLTFLATDALQCIVLPFAMPIPSVCLSMTSRSTAKTVSDRPMVTMGSL